MNVVAASLMNVMRARRDMEAAYKRADWDGVKKADKVLGFSLEAAFDDPERDNRALVGELEKVLNLYAVVVEYLPESTIEQWLSPSVAKDI